MIDIEKLVAQLKSFDALRGDDKINTGTVERIQPRYANDWPTQIEPSIRDTLIDIGIPRLYQHQAEADLP